METIKINGGSIAYPIKDIRMLPNKTLKIVFDDMLPEQFGDIEVFTKSDIRYAVIAGFENVVSIDGNTVILATTEVKVSDENIEPTAEEDLLAMVVDHEYRTTLLELGVI